MTVASHGFSHGRRMIGNVVMDVEIVQLHDNVKFTKLLRVPRMKHLPCFLLFFLLRLNEIPFQVLALSSFSSALCSIVNMDMYFIESMMAQDLVLCYDVSVKLLVKYV